MVNRFSNDGGVTLMLSSPQHVDDILKMDRFNISALPGLSLKALRGRQIEVEHALELVILGVAREYNVNEVIEVLKRWLIRNFSVNEDAMPLHTLAGVRTDPLEPGAIMFHMTTWAAARSVLTSDAQQQFTTHFMNYPKLQPPQLLFRANSSGWGRRGAAQKEIVDGVAASANVTLDKLSKHIDEMEARNKQMHKSTQMQLATASASLIALTNSVSNLDERVIATNRTHSFSHMRLAFRETYQT